MGRKFDCKTGRDEDSHARVSMATDTVTGAVSAFTFYIKRRGLSRGTISCNQFPEMKRQANNKWNSSAQETIINTHDGVIKIRTIEKNKKYKVIFQNVQREQICGTSPGLINGEMIVQLGLECPQNVDLLGGSQPAAAEEATPEEAEAHESAPAENRVHRLTNGTAQ